MNDEDGPVIVPSDEVEASISRSSLNAQYSQKYSKQMNEENEQHRQEYPLLFAAITPHEDVVMACARILDAGNDVSLVREAAAYLEEVEAYRR
jgi:A1 cistron-splicing factor AAR2